MAVKQRNIEIAKNLIRIGLNIEQVSEGTGLSVDEVKKLIEK